MNQPKFKIGDEVFINHDNLFTKKSVVRTILAGCKRNRNGVLYSTYRYIVEGVAAAIQESRLKHANPLLAINEMLRKTSRPE